MTVRPYRCTDSVTLLSSTQRAHRVGECVFISNMQCGSFTIHHAHIVLCTHTHKNTQKYILLSLPVREFTHLYKHTQAVRKKEWALLIFVSNAEAL